MNSALEYRQKAAHARHLAESVLDPVAREQLETVARDYEKMAQEIEKDLSEEQPKSRTI